MFWRFARYATGGGCDTTVQIAETETKKYRRRRFTWNRDAGPILVERVQEASTTLRSSLHELIDPFSSAANIESRLYLHTVNFFRTVKLPTSNIERTNRNYRFSKSLDLISVNLIVPSCSNFFILIYQLVTMRNKV